MMFDDFFTKDLYSKKLSHFAIIYFLTEVLSSIDRQNSSEYGVWEDFNRNMKYLFEGRSPGYGIEWVGITGFFDDEWMHDHEIPFFEEGERFVVDVEDEGVTYNLVQYSRNELKGWIAAALRNSLGDRFLDKSRSFINEDFTDESLINDLKDKCKGVKPWDYGPYDNTQEEVEKWHSTRCNPVIERDS